MILWDWFIRLTVNLFGEAARECGRAKGGRVETGEETETGGDEIDFGEERKRAEVDDEEEEKEKELARRGGDCARGACP